MSQDYPINSTMLVPSTLERKLLLAYRYASNTTNSSTSTRRRKRATTDGTNAFQVTSVTRQGNVASISYYLKQGNTFVPAINLRNTMNKLSTSQMSVFLGIPISVVARTYFNLQGSTQSRFWIFWVLLGVLVGIILIVLFVFCMYFCLLPQPIPRKVYPSYEYEKDSIISSTGSSGASSRSPSLEQINAGETFAVHNGHQCTKLEEVVEQVMVGSKRPNAVARFYETPDNSSIDSCDECQMQGSPRHYNRLSHHHHLNDIERDSYRRLHDPQFLEAVELLKSLLDDEYEETPRREEVISETQAASFNAELVHDPDVSKQREIIEPDIIKLLNTNRVQSSVDNAYVHTIPTKQRDCTFCDESEKASIKSENPQISSFLQRNPKTFQFLENLKNSPSPSLIPPIEIQSIAPVQSTNPSKSHLPPYLVAEERKTSQATEYPSFQLLPKVIAEEPKSFRVKSTPEDMEIAPIKVHAMESMAPASSGQQSTLPRQTWVVDTSRSTMFN